MRLLILATLWLLLVAVRAGEVEKIVRPKTEKGVVSVHYPDGFDPAKRYSVLFWFHGTGGRPNPGIGRDHERFVTVGMSYLKSENVPAGEFGAAHWRECLAVREQLEANGLRLDRNVVAGMSKGGWMAFYIAAKPRVGLHAVGIFAAGKDPNLREVPSLEGRGLSVLVGSGETDPNFPQAQLAVNVLRKAGAAVFYEEWSGQGHTYRRDRRVRAWLDVEGMRADPAQLERFCAAAVEEEFERAMAWRDARDRYAALRYLAGDPRLREAGELWRERVREAGRDLSNDPEVKSWLAELNRLRALVKREVAFFDRRDFRVPPLEKLVAAYQKLLGEVKHPDLAARAAHGYQRAAKMLAIYSAQMKARENPEYQALMKEYVKLQTEYGEANGDPGEEVMARLKEVGARLGKLRHESSMGAFKDAEWGRHDGDTDPAVQAAIEAGVAAGRGKPPVFSGVGF